MFSECVFTTGDHLHVLDEHRLHVVGSPCHLRDPSCWTQLLLLCHLRFITHPRNPNLQDLAHLGEETAFHKWVQPNRPSSCSGLYRVHPGDRMVDSAATRG